MKVIILGSGRVGSAIAHELLRRQHDVTVIDRDPDSLLRLGGEDFEGDFMVGEALDSELLERAGIEQADAFIACTDADNTNLVIAQIAHRRYQVDRVVVRVFDPDKASLYKRTGMRVICPTIRAISEMVAEADPSSAENVPDGTEAAAVVEWSATTSCGR
jgi:trk system potassium uptake protein